MMTVILPCAGEGNRLGLQTPKELFLITPHTRLIDFSLDHIRAFLRSFSAGAAGDPSPIPLTVAVVVRPWKQEVAEYVARRLPELTVETVMFNDAYSEWPGSVYSAARFFSQNNLVLLPDSCLRLNQGTPRHAAVCNDPEGKTLPELSLEALERYPVFFGSVSCGEAQTLKSLGALRVDRAEVTAFQDKPSRDLETFNAFWGCYGFRKAHGEALYHFLSRSVRHQPAPLNRQSFYPVGAIPLHSYYDLGTWDRINRFRREFFSIPPAAVPGS